MEIETPKKSKGQESISDFVNGLSWKVNRASLHQSFQIPGGTMETSFYSAAQAGRSAVDMTYTPFGLFCECKGRKFIVPLANIIGVYL